MVITRRNSSGDFVEVTDESGLPVSVNGRTTVLTVTPVLAVAGAYAVNDLVGTKNTLADAVRASAGKGIIQSVVLADKAKQDARLDIIFFNADPSGSTLTDNGAATLVDADLLKVVGVVTILPTDYCDLADNSVASRCGIGLAFAAAGGDNLYAVLVSRGTPTYAAGDLQLLVTILQD